MRSSTKVTYLLAVLGLGLPWPAMAQDVDSAEPAALLQAPPEEEGDHHEGYYYPKPQSIENYVSPLFALPDSNQMRRQTFVIGMTKQLLGGQYAPSYAIFTKGDDSDKLIIVGLVDGQLDTIYRARALLATFTSVARTTQFFQQHTHPEDATFFDLLKLLGFKQLTVSDGKTFAHQITIN